MKSYCYVVLPENLSLEDNDVYTFVRNHIYKYYLELEVEPYKNFFSLAETLEIAKRQGFNDLITFKEYLTNHSNEDGIENGQYYWISTFNKNGRWDYIILEGVKLGYELKGDLPYSVVTDDGVWYSERDYGYKPILDFEHGQIHSDNVEPREKWKVFLNNFFTEHENRNLAIVLVHS